MKKQKKQIPKTKQPQQTKTKQIKQTKTKQSKVKQTKQTQEEVNLTRLFEKAAQAVVSNKDEINALDGYNGNHGDNMVENINMILSALQEKESQPPAEALRYASKRLQSEGRGGTSKYYAKGLAQAANQVKDKPALERSDVASLVQTLIGAIPAEGSPQQDEAGGSVLDLLGLLGGQQAQQEEEDDGLDAGDVIDALLPAGMAFLQAKQSGAETKDAAGQALGALVRGRVDPIQSNTPRAAAGGVIARSLLDALLK